CCSLIHRLLSKDNLTPPTRAALPIDPHKETCQCERAHRVSRRLLLHDKWNLRNHLSPSQGDSHHMLTERNNCKPGSQNIASCHHQNSISTVLLKLRYQPWICHQN